MRRLSALTIVTVVLSLAGHVPAVRAVEVTRDEKGWHFKVDKEDIKAAWKGTKEFIRYIEGEFFKSHSTVQATTEIDGKCVWIVPVQRDDDTRITYNISFDQWHPRPDPNGPFVRIYIGLRAEDDKLLDGKDIEAYRMQQKFDEELGCDPDKGDEVKPGQRHRLDGGRQKYYAKRGSGDWDALSGRAFLIVADADLTPEQLATLKGVHIVKHEESK